MYMQKTAKFLACRRRRGEAYCRYRK